MNASILKRTLVIAAVVAVPWIGCSIWSSRKEATEKAALAAEIRAAPRPPVPSREGLVNRSVEYRAILEHWSRGAVPQEFHHALLSKARWAAVPAEVTKALEEHAEVLDAHDALCAHAERGYAALLHGEWASFGNAARLLYARGRVRSLKGDLQGLLDTVRAFRRLAAEALVSGSDSESSASARCWVPVSMERSSLDLLEEALFHPGLGEAEAAQGLALTRESWCIRQAHDTVRADSRRERDRFCLDLLGDGGEEVLRRRGFLRESTVLDRFERAVENLGTGRVRRPSGPPSASVLRSMRAISQRLDEADARRDGAALRLGGDLDIDARKDLGGGWTSAHLGWVPYSSRFGWFTEARQAVLHAAFAVRLHEIRTGRSPATLVELVPSILDAVPVDPWTGEPVKFTPRPGGWAIEAGPPRATFTFADGSAETTAPFRLQK